MAKRKVNVPRHKVTSTVVWGKKCLYCGQEYEKSTDEYLNACPVDECQAEAKSEKLADEELDS